MEFFTKLGYRFNPQFTDETAACMIVSEDIYVMLLTRAKFKEFTPKEICELRRAGAGVPLLRTRDAVNDMVSKAVAAGGITYADSEGLWLHVPTRIPRPRRPYLGTHLHGAGRGKIGKLDRSGVSLQLPAKTGRDYKKARKTNRRGGSK